MINYQMKTPARFNKLIMKANKDDLFVPTAHKTRFGFLDIVLTDNKYISG